MKTRILTTAAVFLIFLQSLSAKIWINEFMQSNIDLVRDDLQDFPDSWIELYNDSDQGVNILNWYISDSENANDGWKITQSAMIPAKGYLLIYADKAATGLHTSFRLDSGKGGSIFLFDSGKNRVDAVANIPKQPASNIARGRIGDGGSSWDYFVTATPLKANTGKTTDKILSSPVFSQTGGVFRETVKLTLSLPEDVPENVSLSDIHYTLDNSEPTANSPVYSGQLTVSKPTVVKAKLIHPDYLTNRSQAHSYIIVSRDLNLPVISISLDSAYLWDNKFGIYCRGDGTYGKTGNGVDFKANWNNDWRRPVNFEYFPSEAGEAVLNQLGEMRIAGAWSRANPQKPLIVYANKRFGIKNFAYDLFGKKPGQDIRSFMIRNSGNDFWYTHFRDAAAQLFMGRKVDIDYQEYQPAVFYLNGKYWGIQNLRERSDEDFVLANYNTEDIDMVENWWGELKAGDKTDWNRLMSELRKSSSQMDVQWIMNQIDLNEYLNYMILEIYANNTDFPNNNMVMWKPKTENGKWRFILKDLDQTLGIWNSYPANYNALTYNLNGTNDDSRRLFQTLMKQDSFKKEFYSRFAIYMGDILQYNNAVSPLIDSIQNLLLQEMTYHIDRWRPEVGWGDMNHWRSQVTQMKTWCSQRNSYIYTQLRDYFQLGAVMKMTLETAPGLKSVPTVSINGVTLQQPLWDGSYFRKETIRLRFENTPAPYKWEITATVNGTATTQTRTESDLNYTIPDVCTLLKIRIIDNPTAIPDVVAPAVVILASNRQIQVSGLKGRSQISVYDTAGRLDQSLQTDEYSVSLPVNRAGVWIVKVSSLTQSVVQKVFCVF